VLFGRHPDSAPDITDLSKRHEPIHTRGAMTSAIGAEQTLPPDHVLAWIAAHRRSILRVLIIAAVVLRALLALCSPTPFGYVFDYYHEGIQHLFKTGRLPVAADCWQCYHPPLFYLLGWPLYAVGWWLSPNADQSADWGLRLVTMLPLAAGAVAAIESYRIIRFLTRHRALTVVGAGLILAFPCLFISSYAPEADIVVTAAITAFLYRLTRFNTHPSSRTWRQAVWIGILIGIAMATKYTGLLALATAGIVIGWQVLEGPRRKRAIAEGLVILAVSLVVGSWKYVDNVQRYGTPLFANGSAGDAFSATREDFWEQYEFFSFRPGALLAVTGPHSPPGLLTDQPVYRSVWTTLYGMAWSDLSFFSRAGRIDDPDAPYPSKQIPQTLTGSVLALGSVPTLLAAIGLAATVRRRVYRPLFILMVVTIASYLAWVVAQDAWALKTKYILYLLPVYVTYALVGVRWAVRRLPPIASTTVIALLVALITVAHVWLYAFAVGHL
jgi:4-amino-4-deoxy-L-arabinose transferase-like glycosyltransferase